MKVVLGEEFQPDGIREGEKLLDMLAAHPSTARFIATKLARRFVSDTPPPKLVDRVAERFLETEGDIRQTLRAIFYSREFWDEDNYRAKVKKPTDFVAGSLRALGADFKPSRELIRPLESMGEVPYACQPPTGYDDVAEAWLGSDALVARWNFALRVADAERAGVRIDETLAPAGERPEPALETVAVRLLGEPLSRKTSERILEIVEAERGGDDPLSEQEALRMVGLTLASAEFQRR